MAHGIHGYFEHMYILVLADFVMYAENPAQSMKKMRKVVRILTLKLAIESCELARYLRKLPL